MKISEAIKIIGEYILLLLINLLEGIFIEPFKNQWIKLIAKFTFILLVLIGITALFNNLGWSIENENTYNWMVILNTSLITYCLVLFFKHLTKSGIFQLMKKYEKWIEEKEKKNDSRI